MSHRRTLPANAITLPRLYTNLKDMREAGEFASYILDRGLCGKNSPKLGLVHRAFATSMIVSYSRSLNQARDLKDKRELTLRDYAACVLDADELALHLRVLDMRDKAYAHSDADFNYFDFDYQRIVGLMKIAQPLNRAETESLRGLIKKWAGLIKSEIQIKKAVKTQ